MKLNYDEIENELIKILKKHFKYCNLENLNKDSRFTEDIGFDSLDTVEFILKIEEKFNVQIDDEYVDKNIRKLKDAVKYLYMLGV